MVLTTTLSGQTRKVETLPDGDGVDTGIITETTKMNRIMEYGDSKKRVSSRDVDGSCPLFTAVEGAVYRPGVPSGVTCGTGSSRTRTVNASD